MPQEGRGAGRLPLPQGPIQWWQWSCEYFGPKSPQFQSFWSSKAISMRWSRRCNQINSIMPPKDLQYWETPPAPGTPSSGGSGALWYFGPNTPKFNHFGSSRAISMRWSRRCRSNQLQSYHRRTSSTGETPTCKDPSMVAVVSK
jgi:hypothetical protein